MRTEGQKIDALDGLRALAVLLVFIRHAAHTYLTFSGTPPTDVSGHPLWHFMLNGWIGVDLFFVLSGYLIATSLLQARDHNWKIYAQKRFLRIVPAYVFVLLACVLGAFPFYTVSAEDLGWRIFYHLLFLQDYLRADINVVFWSLGVEEKFYIVAPFLIWWLAGRQKEKTQQARVLGIMLAIAAAGYLFRYLSFLHAAPEGYVAFFINVRSPFHANFETLTFGVLVAFWRYRGGNLTKNMARAFFYAGLAGLLLFMSAQNMMLDISLKDVLLQPLLIALLMAVMVFAVVGGYCSKILVNPIAKYISRISYSFYLVHFPLSFLCFNLWREAGSASFGVYMGVYFAVSFAIAAMCYHAVERPFLNLKDSLDRKSLVHAP
jgi:peptidoglycan/LPS O-acetylase OafA/YrhL